MSAAFWLSCKSVRLENAPSASFVAAVTCRFTAESSDRRAASAIFRCAFSNSLREGMSKAVSTGCRSFSAVNAPSASRVAAATCRLIAVAMLLSRPPKGLFRRPDESELDAASGSLSTAERISAPCSSIVRLRSWAARLTSPVAPLTPAATPEAKALPAPCPDFSICCVRP